MTIALEMAVPGLVGHWLDERFATGFLLTLLGVVLGCSVAFWQLLQIAKNPPNGGTESRQREEDGEQQE